VARLVDLSQEIFQGMGVYPGHLKTVVWDHHTHADTADFFESDFTYASKGLLLSDHGPTHVDALSHLDARPGAPTIDLMPLDVFMGEGTCIDISGTPPRESCSAADLDRAVEAGGSLLRPGDVLLLRTGDFDRNYGGSEYVSQYPGLDESASRWLVEREVKVFGVDSPSPDNPASRIYPVHLMCREQGITHYENLANLGEVVGRRFRFYGFPLKVRGGHGSPVRAVAELDE
jgi:kynurenine formamidase